MKPQSLHELPSYTITSEEFLLDYMPLPDDQKIVLFKLRMGYAMKGGSLTSDDIEGFCPAITDQQKTARQKVLARFFRRENDRWTDDRIQSAIDEINDEKTRQKTIRDKRSTAGKISAQVRLSADKNKIVAKPTNQQNFNKCSTDVGTNDQHVLEQNASKCSTSNQTSVEQSANKISTNVGTCVEKNVNKISTSVATHVGTNVQQVLEQKQCVANNSLKIQENEISENRCEITDSDSFAYTRTHARASDPINNINLLNKKIIGSDARTRAYAHTREENQEKIKEIFADDSTAESWPVNRLRLLLVLSGLNRSAVEAWIDRCPFNHDKLNHLATSIKVMGYVDFLNVISRCYAVKEKENREFKTSVAFVIKALEKQVDLIREQSKPPSPTTKPERFSDKVYRKEGLIQMADGSYRFATRNQR